ncbi:MAG: hypothetical protein QHJ73_11820, partial [Armatimonadota bacterium]|nr:hypothetical protein [Armatimonadota bacterium]
HREEGARKTFQEQQEALDQQPAAVRPEARWGRVVVWATGVLLLALGMVLVLRQQPVGGVGLLVGGVVLLVVGALVRPVPVVIPHISLPVLPLQVSDKELAAAEELLSRCERERDGLAEVAEGIAQRAGLQESDPRRLGERVRQWLDQQIVEATRLHAHLEGLRTAHQHAARERGEKEAALAAAQRELQNAETATHGAGERWRQWLSARGLPADLSPAGARTYLEGARAVQRSLAKAVEAEQEEQRISGRLTEFRQRVEALAGLLGESIPPDDGWGIAAARAWGTALEEARTAHARRTALLATAKEAQDEEEGQRKLAQKAAGQMAEILQKAGARDKDELVRRDEEAQRLRELQSKRRETEAALRGGRGDDEWQAFRDELRAARWVELQQEAEETDKEIKQKADQRDALQQEIGQVKNRMNAMETEAALAEAQAEVQNSWAQARRLAYAWGVQKAAHTLLVLTRSLYERHRQPEAVRRTGELFRQLTDGRWGAVVAEGEGMKVVRAGADGVERQDKLLSRGAREALFLCARLAAIEHAVAHAPLPVALDDVLVNLDRDRRRRALHLLHSLAAKTQVLLLTCHGHIVEEIQAFDHAFTRVNV